MVLSDNGSFLYALTAGAHTIATFRVQDDGQLTPLQTIGGLPIGANGLAAR